MQARDVISILVSVCKLLSRVKRDLGGRFTRCVAAWSPGARFRGQGQCADWAL